LLHANFEGTKAPGRRNPSVDKLVQVSRGWVSPFAGSKSTGEEG